jgi:CheY-like chemotaxis protein
VEGIAGLAQVILDALIKDVPATCEVVVKHDGTQALDYLLCRGTYAGRDPDVMPCVTLVDLASPPSEGLVLLREMRDHEQTRRLPVVAFSSAGEPHHVEAHSAYLSGANTFGSEQLHRYKGGVRAVRGVAAQSGTLLVRSERTATPAAVAIGSHAGSL